MVEFGQGWEGWGRKDTEGAIGVLASACSVMLPSRPWGLAQAAVTTTITGTAPHLATAHASALSTRSPAFTRVHSTQSSSLGQRQLQSIAQVGRSGDGANDALVLAHGGNGGGSSITGGDSSGAAVHIARNRRPVQEAALRERLPRPPPQTPRTKSETQCRA